MFNKLVIYDYIKKIKKEDICNYGIKEGIKINNNDLDIIYNYIKNRYTDIFNNPIEVINEINGKVSDNVYQKIIELYNKYKYLIK